MGEEARIGEIGGGGHAGTRDPTGWVRDENGWVRDENGWVRDENGALRRETIRSMLRRLKGWDYRGRAIYQITITLADRASQALGRLEVKGPAGWVSVEAARAGREPYRPEAVVARVVASELGEATLAALAEMPQRYPQVEILAVQLMPDHVHFVAFVKAPLDRPFGALVRGFKAGAAKRWKALGESSPENGRAQDGSPENGRAQVGSPENGRAQDGSRLVPARSRAGVPSWAEGFQDTVLLHAGQLDNMKRYLADNPRRRAIKALFPELFRVVGELDLPLRLSPQAAARGWFSALGNRFLLVRPLAQVQVSRSDFGYKREPKPGGGLKIVRNEKGKPVVDFTTTAFEEKKAALFAAAKHGSVLISPCVSDGEREIARLALGDQLPLVTLHNKGFSKLQKPSGRYFDACADGRLLMLAPAAWPYQPGEKAMTRFDATAMNRLCQWLVGEDAAEINYHGMKPENIDALARAAAKVEAL